MSYTPQVLVAGGQYNITPRLVHMVGPTATVAQGNLDTLTSGTGVALAASPANALAANRRYGFATTTGANNVAGMRNTEAMVIIGSASPMGGFKMTWRFGLDQGGAGARAFVGFHTSLSAFPFTTTDPSGVAINMIGMGLDAADGNWQIMHNDGSGTPATKVDLTADFARNITSMFELVLQCAPSATALVQYTVRDLSLGYEKTGNLITDLPAGTVVLSPVMEINAAATGVIQRICHIHRQIEAGPF